MTLLLDDEIPDHDLASSFSINSDEEYRETVDGFCAMFTDIYGADLTKLDEFADDIRASFLNDERLDLTVRDYHYLSCLIRDVRAALEKAAEDGRL